MKKSFKRMLAALLIAVLCLGCTEMAAYAAPYKMADGNVFDAEYYAATYPDLTAAGISGFDALYSHYVNNGKAEGRQAYAPGTDLSSVPAYTGAVTTTSTVPSGAGCYLIDAKTIKLAQVLPAVPASDDNMLYVLKMPAHSYAFDANCKVMTSIPMNTTAVATFPLEVNGIDSGLYYKYGFAVKQGGAVKLCTTAQYITNPELLAYATRPLKQLPPFSQQGTGVTAEEKFANWWINMPGGPTGDTQIIQVNNQGLNPDMNNPAWSNALDTHPINNVTAAGHADLYMLNNTSQVVLMQLADRMNRVAANFKNAQDFVIGNEVNERMWNYVAWTPGYSWDQYVRDYMESFRVMYNAVKSANANARVFVCIDQNWDRNNTTKDYEYYVYMDGKDFLAKFNELIVSEGNIDWSLAIHPHTIPLTYAKFWDYSACPNGAVYARMKNTNAMVSFENVGVITNFMTQPAMMSPAGRCRYIIASEVGITKNQGANVQAVGVYAAYQAVKQNPYIEGIIFIQDAVVNSVFTDQAAGVYMQLGQNDAALSAWALGQMGKTSWTQVLR